MFLHSIVQSRFIANHRIMSSFQLSKDGFAQASEAMITNINDCIEIVTKYLG